MPGRGQGTGRNGEDDVRVVCYPRGVCEVVAGGMLSTLSAPVKPRRWLSTRAGRDSGCGQRSYRRVAQRFQERYQ